MNCEHDYPVNEGFCVLCEMNAAARAEQRAALAKDVLAAPSVQSKGR